MAVVGPHKGQPTLSARAGNERRNQIVQADVTMSLLRNEHTMDEILWDHRFSDIFGYTETGERAIDFRRFHDASPV